MFRLPRSREGLSIIFLSKGISSEDDRLFDEEELEVDSSSASRGVSADVGPRPGIHDIGSLFRICEIYHYTDINKLSSTIKFVTEENIMEKQKLSLNLHDCSCTFISTAETIRIRKVSLLSKKKKRNGILLIQKKAN